MTIKMRENENQALPANKIKEASSVLDTWLIRPCEYYQEEYKDCKSMKGCLYEKFIS